MAHASEPVRGDRAFSARGQAGAIIGPNLADTLAHGRPGVAGHRRPPADAGARRLHERRLVALLFLGPALLMLLVLVCYPIVNTFWLSLRSGDGARFVGFDNYVRMFTAPETRRAITNNIVWVVVAPSIVTVLGLIFAVLTERVRRATALKTILFMPMAISFLAAGVTFRLVYDESPERGALNAVVVGVHDIFAPPSAYHGANPRDGGPLASPSRCRWSASRRTGSPKRRFPRPPPMLGAVCAASSGSTSPGAAAGRWARSTRPSAASPG
jgi:alpha-glucoside transport system permease protein